MNKPIIDPEFHALIPPLSEDERIQLEANIKAEGCRDALIAWNGILLDGHNRFEICERLKLPYKMTTIELPNREAAADWIDRNQLGRRNLAPDQMSLLRGRRYNRAKKARGGDRGNQYVAKDQNDTLPTADRLAKEHGVSPATIKRDGKVAEFLEKHPEEAASVIRGEKKLTEVRREVRREKVLTEVPVLPSKKYRVIYADPPWKYGDQLTEDYGPTKFHYPSMTISELCALPIHELAEADSVLFLWVTSPLLSECWPIIKAWGFEYKACFVWDKVKHNWGHYNSVRHEFLLICTRGSCLPDESKLFDSVQSIERTEKHSEKPKEFRVIINTLYPQGKRIELFARGEASGWESWGNALP